MRVCSVVEMTVIKSIWERELLGSMQCDSKSKGLDGIDEGGKDERDLGTRQGENALKSLALSISGCTAADPGPSFSIALSFITSVTVIIRYSHRPPNAHLFIRERCNSMVLATAKRAVFEWAAFSRTAHAT